MSTKVVDLRRVDALINEAYQPYLEDYRRYQVFKGGASAGKSFFVLGQKIPYNMLMHAGYNVMVLRKVGVDNRNSTFAEMKKGIREWGLEDMFNVTTSPMEITCKFNKNKAVFFGLDDVEKRKSVTFETGDLVCVVVEEASEITFDDFMQLDLRLRGVGGPTPKHIILMFNPIDIDSWLKAQFFDHALKAEHGFVCQTTYKDNRFLAVADVEKLEALRDQDEYYYSVYVLNKWGARSTATVFHNLVIESFDYVEQDFKNVRFGMDFGFNHANALIGTGWRDAELYIWYEVYAKHQHNSDFIEATRETGLPEQYTIKGDSAEPDKISEWQSAGFKNCFGTEKYPGSLHRQVHFLRDLPKIHIHETACPNAAREFPRFRYRQLKSGLIIDTEFVEIDDDTIAATRYSCDDLVGAEAQSHFFIKRRA